MNISIAIISILWLNGSTMQTNEENPSILQEDRSNRRESVKAQDHAGAAGEDAGWTFHEKPKDKRFQDLTGMQFGRLTVLGYAGSKLPSGAAKRWVCLCRCGNTSIAPAGKLKTKQAISCGCIAKEAKTPSSVIPEPQNGTKHIPLTKGRYAVVDEVDYDHLMQHSWYCDGRGYASRSTRNGEQKMHRAIMNAPVGVEVDHINLDKIDNRRANLRLASRQENACNQAIQRNNTSGFKGVSKNRQGKWFAQIMARGKHYNLGGFASIEDARDAYASAAKRLHGEFHRIN